MLQHKSSEVQYVYHCCLCLILEQEYLGLSSTLLRHENEALFLPLDLPSALIRHENEALFLPLGLRTVHTNPSRKRSFISTVRPTYRPH